MFGYRYGGAAGRVMRDGAEAPRRIQRLYVVEFDSLAQRHVCDIGMTRFGGDAESSIVAMMRLADLLSEAIVLTDNMIFDGILFHRIGPRRMLQLVGRPVGTNLVFPFEIRSRAGTIEEALLRALREPGATGRDRLHAFEYDALDLPEPERIEIGQRIGGLRVRELDRRVARHGISEGIARLLIERCGAPEEQVRRMQESWAAWIKADLDGQLTIRPAGERDDTGDDRAFALDPVARMRDDLQTADGRLALQWVEANRHERRTTIRARLRDWLPGVDGDQAMDRQVIEFWHNACYLRSLAYAQEAELIEFVLGDPEAVQRRRLKRRRRAPAQGGETRQVRLPVTLLGELGTMPRSVFETVLYNNRDAIADWRRSGDPGAMRRVAYGLLEASDQPDPTLLSRETLTRLMLVVLAAFVADAFQQTPWVVKAPVLLAAVLASSWSDIKTFFRLRGRLGAVIDIRDGERRELPDPS
ncbi:hypothetical protein [Actinomadura sp. HBU206391]|uniref:hypothetical protein n=1 Tax=Actinomadura sp. HBU206391 TaxID=2731692 RepID=UPI0016502305|nr:hypothetical protein [Actinomadura sp. HBU206391]MBC6457725.1 hypothetical protein [Actinomadura sp. HBU206391]